MSNETMLGREIVKGLLVLPFILITLRNVFSLVRKKKPEGDVESPKIPGLMIPRKVSVFVWFFFRVFGIVFIAGIIYVIIRWLSFFF